MQKMQHLTDKESRILGYFYEFKKGHVRQIKNKARLPEHTLLKYLKKLEARKLLFSKRQGNLKIFEINTKNPLTKALFSYFDLLRLENLEYERKKAISEFLLRIKEIKLPYFMVLFGSTAKEDYTKKSDIDMIVVYDVYDQHIRNGIESLVRDISAEIGLKINFILMKLGEFIKEKDNEKNYALQDALKTGYPILGNDLFYEVIFK